MKAIILAAGEGIRLRPYTLDRPKCLVEIDGVSLLDRQLDVLKSEKISPIILIGGYRADMLIRPEIDLRINAKYAETNMVSTLFCAISDISGNLIVSYGDIVYSREILQSLLKSSADIAVTVDMDWREYWSARNDNPLDDAETLKLHKDGRILELGQKPDSLLDIDGQYMGLMKFSAKGAEILKQAYRFARESGLIRNKKLEKAYMTDLLQSLIDAGFRVESVPVYGGWVEIDTVRDLKSEITRNRLNFIN